MLSICNREAVIPGEIQRISREDVIKIKRRLRRYFMSCIQLLHFSLAFLVSIPYICQSGSPIFSDPDENGYPTKLTLVNSIKGKPTTTTTTTTTTKKGQTTRTVSTYRNGTTATTARSRYVNTGDESQLLLWVVVLGVAVAGLLIVILLRKRREDDDEENY